MSVNVYFFFEVQDEEKKWHLAKYYTDCAINKGEPTEWDFEKVVDVDGKKMIEKYELWTGLALRDKLTWCKPTLSYGLPSDISDELNLLLEKRVEMEKKNGIYPSDYDYKRSYSYMYLDELWNMAEENFEDWKKQLKEHVRDEQLEEIRKRLIHLEKIALGGTDKPLKAKKPDELENHIEYLLEDLQDIITLKREISEINNLASQFSGNRWLEENKVRVIYYFQ